MHGRTRFDRAAASCESAEARVQKPPDDIQRVAVEMGERAPESEQGFKRTAVTAVHVCL